MKRLFLLIFILLAFGFLVLNPLKTSTAAISVGLMEMVNVNLNCTTATVDVVTVLVSNETSIIHFPEAADLNNSALVNAVNVAAGFASNFSFLMFTFEGIDASTAEANADAVEPSMEQAFETSFEYNSTETYNGEVTVTYTGDGKSDLVSYTEWLMSQCLNPMIGGFSNTFLGMVTEPGAMVNVMSIKEVGGFNWSYTMSVHYATFFPQGADTHTIDVLELLNAGSLEPSQYALFEEMGYTSMVNLAVYSNETLTFVGCVPDEAPFPYMRGWYVPLDSGLTLTGTFYFGNDPTAVEELTFSFSGVVISEIGFMPLLAAFLTLEALAVLLVKKRK